MTLDALDLAFVARWQAGLTAAGAAPPVIPPPAGQPAEPSPVGPDRLVVDADLVARLLTAGADQWCGLADELERARTAGHRVVALAGGERGEGRTTLVACLAHVLRQRRRDVVVHASTVELSSLTPAPADGGRRHDKRIVLVDAGIWFPPGPIRRHQLLVASLGCDAAILVRRADREPAPARAAALAALGVAPLGEVLTFARAADSAGPGDDR